MYASPAIPRNAPSMMSHEAHPGPMPMAQIVYRPQPEDE